MAENIEELKQTIDSVITSNGIGQITGQGLNLILNDMCDVLGSTGGTSGIYVCAGDTIEMTEGGAPKIILSKPENIELNIIAYNNIKTSLDNKQSASIYISQSEGFKALAESGIEGAEYYSIMTYAGNYVTQIQGMVIPEEIADDEYLADYIGSLVFGLSYGDSQLILFPDGKVQEG